jgi:hypothetical protein
MYVSDLDIKELGGPRASVDIYVASDADTSVSGATVTGSWTVTGSGATFSCTTNASGKCSLESGRVEGGGQTVFTVTDIYHASYIYAPGENTDPDGDSSGTAITIDLSGPAPPTATQAGGHTLHVNDLAVVRIVGNQGNWIAYITATIARDDGQPITSATLYGTWTYAGGGPQNVSCALSNTNPCSGGPIKTGATTATFTVTNVSGPYPYNPGDNLESAIVVPYE